MSLRLDDATVAFFQFSHNPRPTAAQLAQVSQALVNKFQPPVVALCQQHNIVLNRDQLSLVLLFAYFAPGGTAQIQAQNALALYVHVSSTVGRLRTLTPVSDLVAADVAFAAPPIPAASPAPGNLLANIAASGVKRKGGRAAARRTGKRGAGRRSKGTSVAAGRG